jgi:hypothetical protein
MSVDPGTDLRGATLAPMPKSKGRRKPKQTHHEPPPPKEVKVSPKWYVWTMTGLMSAGVLIIILNYIGLMPGEIRWLYIGLIAIAVGMTMLLNFH